MSTRGVLIALLAGCVADDDSGMGPGSGQDPMHELPEGVWEPFPSSEIRGARLAIDGDTLWWAATRRIEPAGDYLFDDQVWLAATSTRGQSRVAPVAVEPSSPSSFDPDIVVTPSAIVAKLGGAQTLLRRYGRDGVPLGDAYVLALDPAVSNVAGTTFVATASGGAQYFAALGSDAHEVAVIDIDATGVQQTTTRFAGTPDPASGGTRAYSVAAAPRPDGSTVVAWDRGYHGCPSDLPASTFTTTFGAGPAGAVEPVRDWPDSEYAPVLASHGTSVYAAWLSPQVGSTAIRLARYPDVTTVIAQLGDASQYIHGLTLVLAGPDRGVIAWSTGVAGDLHVRPFVDAGDRVLLGAEALIPRVDPEADAGLAGVVHVGAESINYYAVGWIEASFNGTGHDYRLYATDVYFSDTLLRPAPPVAPPSKVKLPVRRLRCH